VNARTVRPWLLLALLLGCSTLPEYAAPKGGVVAAADLDNTDLISYRLLTRQDFRGTKAPPEFAAVADRVGAATCGQLRPTNDTLFTINSRTTGSDTQHWVDVKKLSFMALMDRHCSWWNDRTASRAPGYVLQHEQIHFALYELGARKLNASVESIKKSMMREGSSQEAVQNHAQLALNDALVKATEDLLSRNRDFDEDTSLGYRPDRQRAWLKKVNEELIETQPYASPVYKPPG
jgi:hypothetical protein